MRHSVETKLKVQVAIACGVSVSETAKVFGIAQCTVNRWLNANFHQKGLANRREWVRRNPEKAKAHCQKYFEKNCEVIREKGRAAKKKWQVENRDVARERSRQKYKKSSEHYKEKAREHYRANPGYYAENVRKRRKKGLVFPMTAIEKMMCRNYYEIARELTEQTGVPHEVDHIWPISKGGPHLPWNLQVLTKEENRKKRDNI
jgi:5-methylcytosine-specific restriction endonuclease McrA